MQHRKNNFLEEAILSLVFGFLFFAWATGGFFLWVIILFRVSVAFSSAIFVRIVQGQSTTAAGNALTYAVHFWIDGFHRIYDAKADGNDHTPRVPAPFDKNRFIAEALYSLAFLLITVTGTPSLMRITRAFFSHVFIPGLAFPVAGLIILLIICWSLLAHVNRHNTRVRSRHIDASILAAHVLYPDAKDDTTELAMMVKAEEKLIAETNADFFRDHGYPLKLVKLCATRLNIEPREQVILGNGVVP